MGKVQAIIFDFGQVLTDHEVTKHLLASYDRQLGWPEGTLHERLYRGEWWRKVSLAEISETEYFQGAVGEVASHLPLALDVLRSGCFALEPLRPEMVRLARHLWRKYRLALLSNATMSLRSQLIRWPHLFDLFEVVVISAEVGLRKPDRRVYELTLRRLQVEPAQAVFIDDKPSNVAGAQAVGIEGIVFRSPAQLRDELVQRGLLEGHEGLDRSCTIPDRF